MAKDKKQYIAKIGLNFDRLKGLRIEPDQPVPDKLTDEEIENLLAQGWIEEVE